MAKTTFLNNYAGLSFGYAVNTTVVSAQVIMGGNPLAPIGVKVYPTSIGGIMVNMLLEIAGAGQVTVSAVGSDGGGSFFTYSQLAVPVAGAYVRTPWNWMGTLRVTRANNSATLTYYMPVKHDLYYRTQKTSDSGSVEAILDGAPLGNFNLYEPSTVLGELLLIAGVASGYHTVKIIANVSTRPFVYFNGFSLLERDTETGGEYLYRGPAGTLNDSTNNFIGDWSSVAGYAYTPTSGSSAFFYPQLTDGGKVSFRTQKTLDSAVVAVYVNGTLRQNIDLYADPPVLTETTLLDTALGDAAGQYEIELRNTGTHNASSAGYVFYFRSSVVYYSRTDMQALQLCAGYLKQVAAIRQDGAFLDAWDSIRINFDANALYACMGLLAAYQVLGGQDYLDTVKNFLTWFASMQMADANDKFKDGAWNIGYQVNPNPPPTYIPAIAPYDTQGISEIRWVDAVQCLPAFVLWWYWTLSSDDVTKSALSPIFQKGIDGFIRNNYDPETGFFFSSWQNKTAPTIFLYHDAIRRYNSSGDLMEQHNDSDEFFTYSGAWSSYAPEGAVANDEHYTLGSGGYLQFSLDLTAGDKVHWVTQSAWDTGRANILLSADGANFMAISTIDTYLPSLVLQREFLIYTAPVSGTYWFRIQHSGTINPAGNTAPGWQRLQSRFAAGQTDVALGLTALWLLTRRQKYAALAARMVERFAGKYWSTPDARWLISLDGPAPGEPNKFWYPMVHGYTVFGHQQSRLFQPTRLFAEGLQALEPFQDVEGGFHPPGYLEPEYIFSAFYLVGENQLAAATNQQAASLAKEHLKSGQCLLNLSGQQVGGMSFSKRYPYLYTNISGFACLALAGIANPITEQLRFGEARLMTRQ